MYRNIALLALATILFGSCVELLANELEIKTYRFRHNQSSLSERLVLEFAKPANAIKPNVKVTGEPNSGESTVQVTPATLTGAIPEAAINDSYVATSQYLGGITVSTDNPQGGFTVRTFTKMPEVKVDAFWLSQPNRLVIEAYLPNGKRSARVEPKQRPTRYPSSSNVSKSDDDRFLCFPASSRVGLKVKFEPKHMTKKSYQPIPVNLKGNSKGADEALDAIVCYPKTSQVSPTFAFEADEFLGADATAHVPQAQMPSAPDPLATLRNPSSPLPGANPLAQDPTGLPGADPKQEMLLPGANKAPAAGPDGAKAPADPGALPPSLLSPPDTI